MKTLLMRFAAPLQSWGIDSKYESRRNTERMPSKSGVIGLLAGALGRRRDANIDDLSDLVFGVRVDREGILTRDYHTAKSVNHSYVTNRYYLADAVFLVGVSGNDNILKALDSAIQKPYYPLFLGRRSCPPEGRVSLGVRDVGLIEALSTEPWLIEDCKIKRDEKVNSLVVYYDSDPDDELSTILKDVPISFNPEHRRYRYRYLSARRIPIPSNIQLAGQVQTQQDPMSAFADSSECPEREHACTCPDLP